MSHFYATISHSARKNPATARGHKNTGVTVEAASWAGKVTVDLIYNKETGCDEFRVHQLPHHGSGVTKLVAKGVVGE